MEMGRGRYLLKRTIVTVVLIYLVATGLFFFFRAMPGSYLDVLANTGISPDQLAALEEKWGINDPLHVQYLRYLQNLLSGGMGTSFQYGIPVWELTRRRIFNSLVLVGPAIMVAYVLGSVLGGVMGRKRDEFIEKYGTVPLMVAGSFPEFFLAILFIIVFSLWLGWFPVGGILSTENLKYLGEGSFLQVLVLPDFWWHYWLPFSTIVVRYLYLPTLIMRTSVVEVSGQDFIDYHRVTGIPSSLQLRHTMRHASLPVITLFPVSMTRAIGGMVLVEVVFNWPGIGNLLVQSVLARDFPVVQFVFFLSAVWVILGNYAIDVLYTIIDPRVTFGATKGS